ncbi:hypothetical protein AQAU111925_13140 [Aquirufa aurantiipilula]
MPAVCEAVPVTTNLVAAPALIETDPLVAAVPDCGVKVNVPVPTAPVYFNPKLVKLAIPETKSPALVNLFVPDNPEIAPVNVVVTVTLFALASKEVTVLP